jgi:glycosyltransferase involved in cell wall biosynthesis
MQKVTGARFTIMGYRLTSEIERLDQIPGVTVRPNVLIRSAVCEHSLVVLPMISGGGIKNKLLEGAAMGRPIVCTPRACMDLRSAGTLPLAIVKRPSDWVERVIELWGNPAARADLGRQARSWVSEYYSWASPVRGALEAFTRATAKRQG